MDPFGESLPPTTLKPSPFRPGPFSKTTVREEKPRAAAGEEEGRREPEEREVRRWSVEEEPPTPFELWKNFVLDYSTKIKISKQTNMSYEDKNPFMKAFPATSS